MTATPTFGSLCSGIEAASVAFAPLGWRAAWLSEIDPFACALLAHHYPHVPNLGDMTTVAARVLAGDVPAPDLLCGGTPCQAFSVAGKRQSLQDERGNLSLQFIKVANAIDHVRARAGQPASTILWENVPGVLSTRDNAFGCFLAGLAGEDEPLQPSGQKWTHAGAVYGPARAVAWRTLDAQYFGLAQRRKRVFVVASARDGIDPAQVLFEWDGLRRDIAPGRQAGQDAAGTFAGGARQRSGCSTDDAPITAAYGGNNTRGTIDVATALNASASGRLDFESETFIAHTLRGTGFDASEDGTGRGTPLVPIPFDTTQITSPHNHSAARPNSPCHPMAALAHAPAIAFQQQGSNVGPMGTLRAAQNVGSGVPFLAFHGSQDPDVSGDVTHPLGRNRGLEACVAIGTKHNEYTPQMAATIVARSSRGGGQTNSPGHQADSELIARDRHVRRMTPRECERLQGFPDDYTRIPEWNGWRRLDTSETAEQCRADGLRVRQDKRGELWVNDPDGPRYKALGNSWAVPVAAWIGRRIDRAMAACSGAAQRRAA